MYTRNSLITVFELFVSLTLQASKANAENIESGPPEQGGRWGVSPPPPTAKFSVVVPFFADEPFKCAFFERSNQKCT